MSLTAWGAVFVAWGLGALFAIALCKAAARADQRAKYIQRQAEVERLRAHLKKEGLS